MLRFPELVRTLVLPLLLVWPAAPSLGQETTTADATVAISDLDARLERLCERIEAKREELHIPGLAIAVVKDDALILARGFGLADIEQEIPVEPTTLFAVGSTTKAFTTAAIAMLVDEGVMSWDDPVTRYLPGFELDVDTGDASMTIRDLCAHRTGFTRMGLLWAGSMVPREAVLEAAMTAKPWADFRERFLYNNVMYLAAGMAAGVAAERDWDALIDERLLTPLAMTSSGTSISEIGDDPNLAKGYTWDSELETIEHLPMRNLDIIGPAGSINSNVLDMANWVRFQLGRGAFESNQLVGAAALEETWTPQVEIGPGHDYGLGWMVREWNGQRLIEHGGNIDGFAAQVAMLPESSIGFVLLANVTATSLQGSSIPLVFGALLGDAPGGDAAASLADLEPYVGVYIANIGPALTDAEMTVMVKNGALAVDVPGQMTFELLPPDDEGKWYFAVTDQVAVSFNRKGDAPAYSMVMHQAGMDFEVPRKGHEYEAEVPLDELQHYLGRYHFAERDVDCTVLIQNNRLAVDVPGQLVFELHAPDEDDRWAFRVRPDRLQVRFNEGEDGAIESLTMFDDGDESDLPRVGDSEDALPTVEELLALVRRGYGVDGDRSIGAVSMTGTVDFVHQGVSGSMSVLADGLDGYRMDFDLGVFGRMMIAVDESSGWTESAVQPFTELEGRELRHRRRDHPLRPLGDWQADFDRVAILRADRIGDEAVYVVRLEKDDAPRRTVYVSADRGVVLREDSAQIAMNGAMTLPIEIEYGDFREVDGITLPYRTTMRNEWSGAITMQLESVDLDATLPAEPFAPPEHAQQ